MVFSVVQTMLNTSKQEYIRLLGDSFAELEVSLRETFMVGLPARRKRDFWGVDVPITARCLPTMEVNPS